MLYPLSGEELSLSIKVLANADDIRNLSTSEKQFAKKLASCLRKEFKKYYYQPVAYKAPVQINSFYIKRLVEQNPDAGWAELSRKAYKDGYPYEAGTIRNHVIRVLKLQKRG